MFSISFYFKNELIQFKSNGVLDIYIRLLNWLDDHGYTFSGKLHEPFVRKVFSQREFEKMLSEKNYLKKNMFHNINGRGMFIQITEGNVGHRLRYMVDMLINFGIDSNTISIQGFGEANRLSGSTKSILSTDKNDSKLDHRSNPFKQSICVMGESGAGKSVTIKNILDHEQHVYDFIIPSALSGNLLVQYSPSKSEYKLSKLGNMIVDAHNDPSKFYTMVIDEMHKSHVIEMINDELLQAISTKRNKYRFISLDPDSTKLFVEKMGEGVLRAGNIVIPDNFGIIFISSKKEVILSNEDLFNRVDLILLTDQDWNIKTAADLLKKVIPEEEKKSLKRF